jgi:asparagine synthase (glutamine-hydrolysing)
MFFLSQFTRQRVTVALSGDGGDECFAGYETYLADKLHRIARHSPRWLRERLPRALDAVLPVNHRKVAWPEKLRRFSNGLALDSARAHASWRDIFAHGELEDLMGRDLRQHDPPGTSQELFDDYFANHFADVAECDPLDQASYVDIKTWLVDDILVKTDRASMAHALEVRCPLLDHRVVEFGAQLPVDLKLRGFDKKHILKLSQRSRLPDRILKRPKQGFNAPLSHWVRGPLRELCEDTLFSHTLYEWFDQQAIRRLWRDHLTRERDNGLKLFGLLTVGLFLNQRMPKSAEHHGTGPDD